jgi:hypothetical protein
MLAPLAAERQNRYAGQQRLLIRYAPLAVISQNRLMRILSNHEALEELANTGSLIEVRVNGPISFRSITDGDMFGAAIEIKRCEFASLEASFVQFTKHVTLEECSIDVGDFYAAFFLAGLTVNKCRFKSRAWFQCGGHNRDGSAVCVIDTTFECFVNFFDCWYEGPFELRRCTFKNGTNLLGNTGQPFQVHFDVQPVFEDNVGELSVDGDHAA